MTDRKISKPPSHLSASSKRWWSSIASEFQLEPHHIAILSQAAKCLDRIEEARSNLDRDGLVVRDRFGCAKPHPAVAIERDAKVLFARLLRELRLDCEPEEPRLPRFGS
jgi:phage terminase small subunit